MMVIIGEVVFALALLTLGLIAFVSPSGTSSFVEKVGIRIPFEKRTTKWGIRSGGLIAILMAVFIIWVLSYGQQ